MHVQRSINLTLICIFLAAYADEAFSLCGGQNSPSFRQQLEDRSVQSGQNVSFTCVVSNFNRETDQLTWQVGPYLRKKNVIERYVAEIKEFSSTITAFTVPPTNFYFSCSVHYLQRQGENDRSCRIVSGATLTVEYFPGATDLTCSPTHPLDLCAGDVVHVRCQVSRCEPAVNLVWKFNDTSRGRLPRPRLYDVGLTRGLEYDMVAQTKHHLSTIVCVVTSKVSFPSRKLECRIGPLRIFQPPTVSVQPQHHIAHEDTTFQLNCLTHNSFPKVTHVVWACSPGGVLIGCNSTLETITLLVENVIAAPTNVTVTCTVTNAEGTNTSDAIVSVLKHGCAVTNEAEKVYSVELSIMRQDVDAKCLTMACSVYPNKTDDHVNFHWTIDGLPISRSFIGKQGGSHGESSLVVFDKGELKEDSLVTCRVNLSGLIIEESRNGSTSTHDSTAQHVDTEMCERYATDVPTNPRNRILTTRSYSDALELKKDNEINSKSYHLSTRKLLIIIIGVIVVFLLTLILVALILAYTLKYFRKRTCRNLSISQPGNIAVAPKEESDDYYCSAYAGCDSIYETPNVPPAFPNLDDHIPHQEHTYSTADSPENNPSWRTSSETSTWCSSSEGSSGESGSVFLEHEYAGSINEVVYGNQSVANMPRLCAKQRRASFTPSQNRQSRDKECMEVPIPSLPSSHDQC